MLITLDTIAGEERTSFIGSARSFVLNSVGVKYARPECGRTSLWCCRHNSLAYNGSPLTVPYVGQ